MIHIIKMKLFLSSYRLWNDPQKFRDLCSQNNPKLAFIPNAKDFLEDEEERIVSNESRMDELRTLWFEVTLIDLRAYFGQSKKLRLLLQNYNAFWVRGGNTFVLRQAMYLSGMDEILVDLRHSENELVYGGDSAWICILSPSLESVDLVDDPDCTPYGQYDVLWDWLSILPYMIVPHFESEHEEAANVDQVVEYLEKNNIEFKTLRDGETIII